MDETDKQPQPEPRKVVLPEPDDESLWTAEDVARYLRVPVSWVYDATRKRAKRKIPHLKVGRYPRFEKADVIAFKETLRRDYPRTQLRINAKSDRIN